jgi:predicted transcriptional regulator
MSSLPEIRLHEGELNIMELLWSNKSLAAKDISKIIKEYIGWEKNTTYTVINRLIEKGAVKREDAAISKRTVQTIETKVLLNKLYNGSLSTFLAEYLKNQDLSKAEVLELQRIIGEQRF